MNDQPNKMGFNLKANLDELYEQGCYESNNGDSKRAAEIFDHLVKLKYTKAYDWLAYQYATGDGVEKSPQKAADLYLEGINLGDSLCAYNLGSSYLSGHHGLGYDYEKGIQYLKLSKEMGIDLDVDEILKSVKRMNSAP